MPDQPADAFLAAIRDNPTADAPRLVYADWLEDHGQAERAEFIRVQCRLAGLPEWDARRPELSFRERALLDRHARAWMAELPQLENVTWGRFERGFVAVARVANWSALFTHADAIHAAAPIDAIELREH